MEIKNNSLKKRVNIRYNYNDDYFKIIDSESKAYILGFIIADGCISRTIRGNCITNRLSFNNSIDDHEIIKFIGKELGKDIPIYNRFLKQGAKNRKEQLVLRINSYQLCEDLINIYNIIPRKTLNNSFKFNFDLIPEELVRHFIRGFFDGDGSVSFHRTKNTIFFNFSFIFNSLVFTKQISNIICNLFNIKEVIYTIKGKTVYYHNLRFNYNRQRTNKIKEIYDYLYKDSNIFLTRKKLKFEEYFKYRAKSLDNTNEQCNA